MSEVMRYDPDTCAEMFPADDGRYVESNEFDRVTAERDALQQRLNAADQLNDDRAGTCEWSREDDSGIWNSGCGEAWSFHEDGPEENGMQFCHSCGKHLVVEVAEQEQDDDWHMNPCKQGHRDVGASGGVAACNQCDEKIEAATTQEAFERWNETHPAAHPIDDQLRDHTKNDRRTQPRPGLLIDRHRAHASNEVRRAMSEASTEDQNSY